MLPTYQLPGVGLGLLTGEVRHNIWGNRGGAGHDGSGGCGGRVLQVTDRLLLPQSAGQLLQRSKENISVNIRENGSAGYKIVAQSDKSCGNWFAMKFRKILGIFQDGPFCSNQQ